MQCLWFSVSDEEYSGMCTSGTLNLVWLRLFYKHRSTQILEASFTQSFGADDNTSVPVADKKLTLYLFRSFYGLDDVFTGDVIINEFSFPSYSVF